MPFENDHFVGSVFFAHRPSRCCDSAYAHAALLEASGSSWEIQIQGRFKIQPRGELCCGGELPRLPVTLRRIMKTMCRVILTDVKVQTQQDGTQMLHTPITQAHRLFRSDAPIALPIHHEESCGTWGWSDGKWLPLDRNPLPWLGATRSFFDTHHYFAFSFNSPHLNFESWTVTGIPGIGSLDLGRFLGSSAVSVKLFDDVADGSDCHCFVDLQLMPPCARVGCADGFPPCDGRGRFMSSHSVSTSGGTDVSSHSDLDPEWQQPEFEFDEDLEAFVPDEVVLTEKAIIAQVCRQVVRSHRAGYLAS